MSSTCKRRCLPGLTVAAVILLFSGVCHAGTETTTYTYDALGRLTGAGYGDGTMKDYVYDNMGNVLHEATTLSGSPGNTPPNGVANPAPADGSTGVSASPTLAWTGGGDPDGDGQVVRYLYFGTTQDPPLVWSGRESLVVPGRLKSETTYYWKVVAKDSHNAETPGPLWSFTTEYAPPPVSFLAAPTYGAAPLEVRFIDTSGGTDQPIASRAWDFDSDGTVEATTRDISHVFPAAGNYSVTLTVTDSSGEPGTVTKTDCIRVFEDQRNITGNITWSRANSPYYISRELIVAGSLTIEPGVVVKFEQGASLAVFGVLNAAGTPDEPIYFTDIRDDAAGGDANGDGDATMPAPGWWLGVKIYGGAATLDHTVIRYAGTDREHDRNIYVGSAGATSCGSLRLTNSTISYGGSYGIHMECASGDQVISGNTIERNRYSGILLNDTGSGVMISDNAVKDNGGSGIYVGSSREGGGGSFASGNTIQNNEGYGIFIDASGDPPAASDNIIAGNALGRVVIGGTVGRDVTWTKAGGPYVIEDSVWVSAGKTLTIEPGVVVKFDQNALLGVFGGLIAGGTSAAPIYFTDLRDDAAGGDTNGDGSATGPAPGWWIGIKILGGGTAALDHVAVRYGGPRVPSTNYPDNPEYDFKYANVYKTGAGSVSITDSTISDSAAYGLHIEHTSAPHTLTGNTIERNGDSGIYLLDAGSKVTAGANTIRENGRYGIFVDRGTMPVLSGNDADGNAAGPIVRGGRISMDTTWTKAGSPYVIGSIDVEATLTVEPGVVIKFVEGGNIWVSGSLHAAGTATEPISFTDLRDDSVGGDTNGDGDATGPAPGWWNGIIIGGGWDAGSATLDHTVVRYGGKEVANIFNPAAWVSGYGACLGSLTVTNSTVSDSGAHGIFLANASDIQTISSNLITTNKGRGIYFANVGDVELTNNLITENTGGGAHVAIVSPPNSGVKTNIINNTITGNSSSTNAGMGIVNFSSWTVNLHNNIIRGNTSADGRELGVLGGPTVRGYNNDFEPSRMNGTFTEGGANIDADPMFTDAANGDYHLAGGSFCIDRGDNAAPSLPAADFEGDERIVGPAADIGADEHTAFPDTRITGIPANPASSSSATFTFRSTKQNAAFECSLDSAVFAACTSPKEWMSLAEGSHTFSVRSTVGMASDPTPAIHTWIVDTTGPGSPVVNGTPATKNPRPLWTWTSSGVWTGRYRYKLDGSNLATGAVETMSTSYSPAPALAEGPHTLYVQEMDDAGNWSESGWKTIQIDVTAPVTTITATPAPLTNLRDAAFSFSASEADATFQCRLDGGAFSPCTSPETYSALSDGSHTFSVTATDAVGNTAAIPSSYTWTIDTLPPAPPAVGGTSPAKTSKPTWTWASGGGGDGTYRYKLDDGDLSAGATGTTATSFAADTHLADGSHTLYVQENDAAGNWSASGSFTVLIDTTPVVSGTAYANNAKPTWTWESGGGGGDGTYRYKLDDGNLASGATATTDRSYTPATALSEGWHTLYVQEKNARGEWSASGFFTITVDTTRPSSAIILPANGTILLSSPVFISGDTSDTTTFVNKVELSFDGGVTFSASADGMFAWMYNWQPREDGTYTIKSRATDMAGNMEIPGEGITITVSRKGNVDGNNELNLADAILALQAPVEKSSGNMHVKADVDGDGRVGLPEASYILRRISGF